MKKVIGSVIVLTALLLAGCGETSTAPTSPAEPQVEMNVQKPPSPPSLNR